jgi:membrane fusion protein (multidrug efflux system)
LQTAGFQKVIYGSVKAKWFFGRCDGDAEKPVECDTKRRIETSRTELKPSIFHFLIMRTIWKCAFSFGLVPICAAGFSVLILFAAGCKKKSPPPAPPEVQIITLAPTNVPIFEEWIGTLDGFVNAQIRAQATGYLLKQDYAEGGEVKKGDLLFQIDPRPFQASLDQAKAKLAQDQAQSGKTELDVKRYTPLAKEQAISQEELDNAVQANIGAKAQVQSDEAAVTNAELNLSFTKITSPIDGLAGTAQAQIGDLVGQSGSMLTTVSTINPIKVYFQVSEQSYLNFWRKFIGATNGVEDSPLQLIFSDGSTYPQKGNFFYAGRQVNPNTGTLQIFALFPNADFILRPGQYGRVRAQTHVVTNAILVPQRAVTELQGTYQVALIGETNSVHIQSVKVGEQVGENWIIANGLKAGDRIVVEGTQKAKEGAVVNPKPFDPNHPESETNNNSSASQTNSSSQTDSSK